MKQPCLALLFFLPVCLYPQDTNIQKTDPMDEFASLRGRHVVFGLPPEDLFRLANLYLISGIYPKSAELYAELIHSLENYPSALSTEQRSLYLARSHYNRGLALFTLGLYESAKANFERARYYDPANIEALRMLGSVGFAQKDKEAVERNWEGYLAAAPDGPVKESVQKALALIRSPDFRFDPEDSPLPNPTWPFRSYETVPYPDALYEKKRVI